MDLLPPIPIPPAQKWRYVRSRFGPALVFGLTLLGIVAQWRVVVAPAVRANAASELIAGSSLVQTNAIPNAPSRIAALR